MNESAIAADFGKAVEAQADTTSLPYLGWEQVFRDPKLQSLIRLALANNKDLKNAKLNVDIAHAQLKGQIELFPAAGVHSQRRKRKLWRKPHELELHTPARRSMGN